MSEKILQILSDRQTFLVLPVFYILTSSCNPLFTPFLSIKI